jgi:hypothetical protein
MTEERSKSSALRPSHQISSKDYPGEWARQIELGLDQEGRRLLFYGGLFGAFVLAVVIAAIIGVIIDAPPTLGR